MTSTLEEAPLINRDSTENSAHQKIGLEITIASFAMLNGFLFYAIATEGKNSLSRTLHVNSKALDDFSIFTNIISAISYAAFFRSTLKNLHLRPRNPSSIVFCLLSPFAASAYCSSGIEGAESLSLPSAIANTTGILLFILRILSCVDSANKFPAQLDEMKHAWHTARHLKNHAELARLVSAVIIACAYCIASTDAFFNSTKILLRFMQCPMHIAARVICYSVCALGSIGTLPLSLYWTHQGILAVTNSGSAQNNNTAKPRVVRDRYTLLSVAIAFLTITGTLGAASNKNCEVFCSLGAWTAWCVVIPASAFYAVFAGIPGISTALRDLFSRNKKNEETPSENLSIQHNTI